MPADAVEKVQEAAARVERSPAAVLPVHPVEQVQEAAALADPFPAAVLLVHPVEQVHEVAVRAAQVKARLEQVSFLGMEEQAEVLPVAISQAAVPEGPKVTKN